MINPTINKRKLRVVLDLNILVSAYFFSKPDAPPRRILQAALDKRFTLLHSPAYCIDLTETFSKEKFVARLAAINQTPQSLVDIITHLGEGVQPAAILGDVIRDQDDVIILACAVGGQADLIVSGDKDLTVLKTYRDIPVLTPAEFLALLDTPPTPPTE